MRIYMKKINILLLLTLFSMSKMVLAQVTGDYRTAASGNWDALATWQMYNGSTWVSATVKPVTTNNVLVGNGFNVTANTNEACKDLIVQDGSTLTLSHNIINSGNVSVGGIIDLGISTLQNKGGGGSNENFTVGGSPVTLTGDITNGSTTLVIAGAILGVIPGMTITGTGIPINTCVLSVSGFNIIMSQAATSNASGQTFNIRGANTIKTANPLGIDGSIIQISRNFTDGASYVFNAATTTPFPVSTSIIAKDLTVNSSITLNDPVTVSGTMTLNAGNIITTFSSNLLTLGSAATFIGGSPISFINGPLQLTNSSTSPTTLLFPIGKDNSYRPMSLNITQNAAVGTTYKAEMFNKPPVSRNLPGTLDRVSFSRYYNITKGTGANITAVNITINYDVTGSDDGVTDASNLRVAKDNGLGGWIDLGGDNTSINFTGSITPANSFTTFGDFILANNTGGTNLLGGQVPPPPALLSPTNLAVNVPVNTSLVWGASTGAVTYRLMLATDANFINIRLNDSTLADTTRLVGPLQNNTNYYWKISGKNFLGTGTFSTTFKFTTIVAAPGVPVLITPANEVTNQPINISLNWNSVPLATKYGVQVSTDSTFSTLIINDTTVTTNSRAVNGLLNSTKYYWRVNANNVGGTSSYSTIFNFTTIIAAPGIPVLVSPVNGAINQQFSLTLNWNSVTGAASYGVQVSTDSAFNSLIVNDTLVTDTNKQISSLSGFTKYYWRVKANNISGTGGYSAVFNFTTVLSAPQLLSPANGEPQGITSQVFTWSSVNGAQTYHFQLAKDSLFAVLVANDSLLTLTTTEVHTLTLTTKYYWRVLAKNQSSISVYSTIFNFIVAITGINDKPSTIPTVYSLYQNYPNPFNPSTIIRFDLPEAGFVTMKIYNILGKEVRTLVNEFRNAGKFNITFEGSNLPSGIYIYTIKSNNFSSVKKMMLLK
jgi:Secretion system C-terminal sorting domain